MMKKLILILLSLLVIGAGAAAAYIYLFSPSSRAKSAADSYMELLRAGDSEAAMAKFDVASIGTVTLRNYRHTATTEHSGDFFVLYTFLDDINPTKIRIQTTNGSISDVTAGTNIGNIPSEDKEEASDVATDPSSCLTRSDLDHIDSTSIYARYIRGATMIFLPQTTDYKTARGGGLLLDRMASFYENANAKDFVFELRGYMQTSGLSEDERESREDLFQQRATKLQQDLVQRGVPLDRILIDEDYTYYLPEQATEVDNPTYVDINVVNRCVDA